ncbi:MAG TPA: hypothetical protein VFD58_05405 [Blastocatellia bacterium]|nr:hypothetical protein [Blastocatellia bacterium]
MEKIISVFFLALLIAVTFIPMLIPGQEPAQKPALATPNSPAIPAAGTPPRAPTADDHMVMADYSPVTGKPDEKADPCDQRDRKHKATDRPCQQARH